MAFNAIFRSWNLDSEIKKVKTFHIEKHTNAKDPELFLKQNLAILGESTDIDYIIISVGTTDITKLNLEEDIGDLNNIACEHSKNLAHLANETSQKYNIDVFFWWKGQPGLIQKTEIQKG